jgi:hypothetical protein
LKLSIENRNECYEINIMLAKQIFNNTIALNDLCPITDTEMVSKFSATINGLNSSFIHTKAELAECKANNPKLQAALAVSRQETAQCEADKETGKKETISVFFDFFIPSVIGTVATFGIIKLIGIQMAVPINAYMAGVGIFHVVRADPFPFRYTCYMGLLVGVLKRWCKHSKKSDLKEKR